MARLALSLALLALLAFSPAASSADARDPALVLDEIGEQIHGQGTLRGEVIVSDHEDLRSAARISRSTILARFTPGGELEAARVESRLSGEGLPRSARSRLTISGDHVQLLDFDHRVERLGKTSELLDDAELMTAALPLLVTMLFDPNAEMSLYPLADDFRDEGTRRDGRDLCRVLSISDEESDIRIFVDDPTGELRRMDVEQSGVTQVIRFNRMVAGARIADSSFEIRPAPRNFRTTHTEGAQPKRVAEDAGDSATGPESDRPVGLDVGDRAPEWTLADETGKPHSLSDYRGEIVLMDFWATWCPPCRAAMPGLQRLHEELEGEGLNVIGINTSERSPDLAPGFMRSNNYTYELLLSGDAVARQYDVRGIPTFYVIGTEGEILFKGSGYSHQQEKDMERVIREALGLAPRGRSLDELDEIDIDNLDR
jgi:thiol-disulfide isomerase/thioredoxin